MVLFYSNERKVYKGKIYKSRSFDGYWEVTGSEKKSRNPRQKLQLGIRSNLFSMSMKEKVVDWVRRPIGSCMNIELVILK